MKKYLSFIVAGIVACLIPMSVNAARIDGVCNKSTTCKENEKCTSTCVLKVEGNTTTLSAFDGSFNVKGAGAKVTSVQPGDGWQLVSPSSSELSGSTIPVSFISESGVSASSFVLMTVNLELEDSATDCSIELTSTDFGQIEIEIEQTIQTRTGAALPIAIIGVGACAAVVIYMSTKKSKKIYKI